MKLSEIYSKGAENLKEKKLLFYFQGVETERAWLRNGKIVYPA